MDIQLISIDPLTRVASLKLSSKFVSGIHKLIQIVILSLLNTPGRDLLDPDRGAGIPEMIGMNYDSSNMVEILGEITRRVKISEKEIMTDQIGLNLPPAEKLQELKVISVSPGATLGEVKARIRIINELGQQSEVVM